MPRVSSQIASAEVPQQVLEAIRPRYLYARLFENRLTSIDFLNVPLVPSSGSLQLFSLMRDEFRTRLWATLLLPYHAWVRSEGARAGNGHTGRPRDDGRGAVGIGGTKDSGDPEADDGTGTASGCVSNATGGAVNAASATDIDTSGTDRKCFICW